MNIGNLLNEHSPKIKAGALPDLRAMNDAQLGRDAGADRRPMQHAMSTAHSLAAAPYPGYQSAYQHSYAPMPASYGSMPQTYPQQAQLLAAQDPSAKQDTPRIVSGASEVRTMASSHRDSPAQSPDNPTPKHLLELPKSFACGTCGKGFARRSDLVRHERIHSGIRPHKCPWPYCDKQFIQRSALTVHERVHSGEKPHMCEKCSKQFSDSSSLARHRRIHSGKRPYKCPYPDCQKTFTRRTTLTRHQNNHTGSLEEAAANRAAALASHASAQIPETGDGRSAEGEADQSQSDASSMRSHQTPQNQAQQPPPQNAAHLQQANLSRTPSYGQAMPSQGYYASNLPHPQASLGSGTSSAPVSRPPSALDAPHQYRGPVNSTYPAQAPVHSASHSPSVGMLTSGDQYSYQSEPRYQPAASYNNSTTNNTYYGQAPMRAHTGHEATAYEPQPQQHGQMSVPWTQSM